MVVQMKLSRLLIFFLLIIVFTSCLEIFDTEDPNVIITYPANNSTVRGIVKIRVDVTDNKKVDNIELLVDGVSIDTLFSAPWDFYWNSEYYIDDTVHTVLIKAYDNSGNTGYSELFTFNVAENHYPTINSLTAEHYTMMVGSETTIVVQASDADGDNLTFEWYTTGGSISDSTTNIIYMAPQDPGNYYIICSVYDGYGGYDIDSVCVYADQSNFIINQSVPIGSYPLDMVIADINYDGYKDLIHSRWGNSIYLYINDGNGNFTLQQTINTEGNIGGVITKDIDSDNKIDIICYINNEYSYDFENENTIAWYRNDGFGNFNDCFIIDSTINHIYALSSNDFNNDGENDVVYTSAYGYMAWYENIDKGDFGNRQLITTDVNNASFVYTYDFDQDSDIDIVTRRNVSESDKIVWFENDGQGRFGSYQTVIENPFYSYYTFFVDFDNDSDDDIIGQEAQNDQEMFWYENDGNNNFTFREYLNIPETNNFRIKSVENIDNDNDVDIIANCYGEFQNLIYLENIDFNFDSFNVIGFEISPSKVYAFDVDSDSDMDIVAVLSDEIIIFKNTLVP